MVRIVTDSSSNITPEEAEELGVTVIPLTVIFGSDELRDGVDITAEAFYDRLARDKNHPHTSQINTAQFEEIFRDAQAKGEKLILLPISAALSGTHAAAVKAKENVGYDGIYVYDTRTTTVMLKMLVLEARRLADREPEEIIAALDDLRSRTELYAMVDTLEYLWKGGRMARGTAMLGGLFRVKPIITIKSDGSLDVVAKAIGTRSAIKNLRKFVNPETIDPDVPVYYIYTVNKDNCERLINEVHPDRHDEYLSDATNICPVIGVHIGPGAVGICFARKKEA
ncbi:MAG TPA: DegV family protein [Firmicutes bacterium]|nr:DegV family protein [Bacillota bacterium]